MNWVMGKRHPCYFIIGVNNCCNAFVYIIIRTLSYFNSEMHPCGLAINIIHKNVRCFFASFFVCLLFIFFLYVSLSMLYLGKKFKKIEKIKEVVYYLAASTHSGMHPNHCLICVIMCTNNNWLCVLVYLAGWDAVLVTCTIVFGLSESV